MGSQESKFLGVFDGHTYSIPNYGGVDTPYLTSTYAKNAMNDISNEKVKDAADSADFTIDEDGTINSDYKDAIAAGKATGVLDSETLSESQSATGIQYQTDVHEGIVSSEVEIASNGARSDNKVYNAATGKYEYDQTGELKSDDKNQSLWQRLVIDGATGLALYGVTKGVTDNKLLGLVAGIGGTAILDYTDILPESLAPVLTFTSNLLPDGSIKDKLNEWAKDLSGSTIAEQKENLTPENVANQHQEMRLEDSVKAANSVMIQDVSTSMNNNGYTAGTSMAFWATAKKGEKSAQTVNDYVVSKCTFAMEEQWTADIKMNGLTDDTKNDMKNYYTKMFDALKSYNDGVKQGIANSFGTDSTRGKLSLEGLNMVNRSYTSGVMDSFVKMNDKYHFMTTEELKSVQGGFGKDGISGICDLMAYKNSASFDSIKQESSANIDALLSMDALESEDATSSASKYTPDYGVSQDSVNYKGSATTSSKSVSKSLTKSSKTLSETQPIVKDDANKSFVVESRTEQVEDETAQKSDTNRAVTAESKFGHIFDNAKNSSEMSYE